VSSQLEFDEQTSRQVERIYTTPDIVARRRAVLGALGLRPGEHVLDIGCGPGFFAAEMAAIVGPSGRICGIDISKPMLAMSQARCAAQPWVQLNHGSATILEFPKESFDAAISVQVYEYVAEIAAALSELYRVLRPRGRAIIVDTDWDSLVWYSSDRERMARILNAWNEHLADPYLPRTLGARLREAGFAVERPETIHLFDPEYRPDGISHGLIDVIAEFVPGRRDVTAQEAIAWAQDLRKLGQAGTYFLSLTQYLFLVRKPGR
jgi:ubiquinone/menaquinone biosynthesis C-methylase UbiE